MGVEGFIELHDGFDEAFGVGSGGWLHRPPARADFEAHLRGEGTGIGIAPLRRDGTVSFAAIDLDEPDFDLAREMQELLPGQTWIERSRSGNAHVWCFFAAPVEAWVARGVMRETTAAVGRKTVEVFPKQDRLLENMVGSYINLSYHGDERPILWWDSDDSPHEAPFDLFVQRALERRAPPTEWRNRARWLGLASPEQRERGASHEWGEQPYLHRCAEWIIANRERNPVVEGHRAAVYFAVACQVLNTEGYDENEALDFLHALNDASPDTAPESELRRIVKNASRGRFTSTRCDDPLVVSYCDPDCPIVKSA